MAVPHAVARDIKYLRVYQTRCVDSSRINAPVPSALGAEPAAIETTHAARKVIGEGVWPFGDLRLAPLVFVDDSGSVAWRSDPYDQSLGSVGRSDLLKGQPERGAASSPRRRTGW